MSLRAGGFVGVWMTSLCGLSVLGGLAVVVCEFTEESRRPFFLESVSVLTAAGASPETTVDGDNDTGVPLHRGFRRDGHQGRLQQGRAGAVNKASAVPRRE